MTKPAAGKSRKKEQLLAALLTERSIEQAAKLSGVSKRTALRWMDEPAFDEQFRKVKLQLLRQATAKLRMASGKVVDVLEEIACDVDAPPAARVTASRSILELVLRANEQEELEARIEALERQSFDV